MSRRIPFFKLCNFLVVPTIVFNETRQQVVEGKENESLSLLCRAEGEPMPIVFQFLFFFLNKNKTA